MRPRRRRFYLGSREDWVQFGLYVLAIGLLLWVTSVVERMTP